MAGRMIPKGTWSLVARSALAGFQQHSATTLAAALTYYAVLALFPGLLAVVSLLGVFGDSTTTDSVLRLLEDLGQRDVADQLEGPIRQMVETRAAGLGVVIGLAGAIWSASGYVNGFGQAINQVYGVSEGRPFWKLRPLQLAITTLLVALAALVLVGLVVSGPLAQQLGDRLGAGDTAVRVWEIAKYPVLLLIVAGIVAMLYSLTPNIRRPIRPFSAGAVLAILVWVAASLGFGAYVANFGSYNATYGSLAGIIVFLLWLYLTNLALMFGAEVDAEVERMRELLAGRPAERSLQLHERDVRGLEKRAAKTEALVAERATIREAALADQARATREAERAMRTVATTAGSVSSVAPAAAGEPSTPKVLAQVAGVGVLSAVIGALAGLLGVGDRRDR